MKLKYLTLGISMFLVFQSCFSQKNSDANDTRLRIRTTFSFGAIYPIEFGNTALSKAHSPNVGFTTSVGLLKFTSFSAGFGVDLVGYNVTDTQITGDYTTSKHNSYFIFLNYDYDLTTKFSITPTIGYGESELAIRKSSKRRGSQDGKEFRLGSSINYNINKYNAFCFSILYVNNTYNVNANESIKDYFKKSNSIQLGIVYRIR